MKKSLNGFTIVELLIVIVVIAILAAISVVGYNGVQDRAHDTILQNDLSEFGKKAALYEVDNGSYPTANSAELAKLDVGLNTGSYSTTAYNVYYCTGRPDQQDYALIARSKSGSAYYVSSAGSGKMASSGQSWQQACGVIGYSDVNDINFIYAYNSSTGNWSAWSL